MDDRRFDSRLVRARATAGLPGWRAGTWRDVPDTSDLRDLVAAGLVSVDLPPDRIPSPRCCGG